MPHGGDEELAAVRVGSGVGHRQDTRAGVAQLEAVATASCQGTDRSLGNESRNLLLVGKLVAVDALAASAVTASKVTTLDHKVLDHPEISQGKSALFYVRTGLEERSW